MAQLVFFVFFNSNRQVALRVDALFIIMPATICISIELYEIVDGTTLRNLTCIVHVFAIARDYVRKL